MIKIVQLVENCQPCPNRMYASGGVYECRKKVGYNSLPENHREHMPDWCPLVDYPTAAVRTRGVTASQAPSVEEVFDRYANRGYSPALVFDDDGRWAVSDMGSSPVPDGEVGHTETVCIGSVVKPEQWKPTIREALALFVAENPLADVPGVKGTGGNDGR